MFESVGPVTLVEKGGKSEVVVFFFIWFSSTSLLNQDKWWGREENTKTNHHKLYAYFFSVYDYNQSPVFLSYEKKKMKGYPFWLTCKWRLEQVAFLEMEERHNTSESLGCSLKKEWIC